jgi:hypothetical protein
MAVSLLEFFCGAVDQVGSLAELALQHLPVGVIGDEHRAGQAGFSELSWGT